MKRLTLFAFLIGGLLVMAPTAQATVLTPGTAVVPSAEAALPAGAYATGGGPFTTSFTGTNALGQTRFTGELTFAVYREAATGFLDFIYQVHNDRSSRDGIEHVSNTSFGGAFTDVTYLTTAPSGFVSAGRIPQAASRSPSGEVVSFDFLTPHAVDPGQDSRVLVIHTHDTLFIPGTTSMIDGAISTVRTFGPNTPEPNSLVLFAGCFAGMAGCWFWKVRRNSVPVSA